MSYIFTWVPVYKAISDKLDSYAGRGSELAEVLIQLSIDTTDEEIPGQKVPLDDIDPVSFISCLNKFSDERALGILRQLCNLWNIPLQIFDLAGIPRTDPRRAYIFPFKRERTNEIDRLWNFFKAVRAGALTDEIVADVLAINGVGWPKLTEGLFMLNPQQYLCLNKMVRPYLESKGIVTGFNTYSEYLLVLEKVKTVFGVPFYEISHNSYRWNEEREHPPKYWRIGTTAGTGGTDILPEMLKEEVVSIGWDELGDLLSITPLNQTGIRDKLFALNTYDNLQTCSVKAGEIIAFKDKIRINDYVVACKGGAVRAIGQVQHGQYIYNPDLQFPHCRSVEWLEREVDNLNIAGTQQTVNEIYHAEDIDKIKKYLVKPAIGNTPPNIMSMNTLSLNTILYGPPGTGKTFKLQGLFESFTDKPKTVSTEDSRNLWIRDTTWWELLAHVLYHAPNGITVPQLKQNDLVQSKFAQSDIKNASARLWSTLQHHTVAGCPAVALERRLSPPLFWKEENSIWRLDNKDEFAAEYPELVTGPNIPTASPSLAANLRRYRFTTAHQSWSYEDFVEGIKPRLSREAERDEDAESSLSYHMKDGLFYEVCDEAARLAGFRNLQDSLLATKDERQKAFSTAPPFALFIDEINRCNISAVLGELITLIEEDKRLGNKYEISDTKLPYSRRFFGVPANLYIIGTMNTADRSVEALDTALRRRFYFEEKKPEPKLLGTKSVKGISLQNLLQTINTRIAYLLDEDHCVGHSYFYDIEADDVAGLSRVFKNNIIPLLKEYFYNDYEKIQLILGDGFVIEKEDVPLFASKRTDDLGRVIYEFTEIDPAFDIITALKATMNV